MRWPEIGEKNANIQLVQRGATAVNIDGDIIEPAAEDLKTEEQKKIEILNNRIIDILSSVEICSSKDILSKLSLDWSDAKMKKYLEAMSQVKKSKVKNRVYYSLKNSQSNILVFNFD